MSLVGDYGSDSEEEKQEDKKVEKKVPSDEPAKKKSLPPLPSFIGGAENGGSSSHSSSEIGEARSSSSAMSSQPNMKRADALLPPQLWRKTGNIATEDTEAWNTKRAKGKKPDKMRLEGGSSDTSSPSPSSSLPSSSSPATVPSQGNPDTSTTFADSGAQGPTKKQRT